MAVTIREQQDAGSGAGVVTLTLGSGTAVGDLLVVVAANDWYNTAHLTAPTGTAASTWTLQHTLDGGTNDDHAKVWTAPVTTAGARTVVEGTTSPNDEERYIGVWVLDGSAGTPAFDTAASTDADTAGTSWVAPSVTGPSGQADDLLICLWGANGASAGSVNITPPAGMTSRTERDVSGFTTYHAADQQLASSAATGTRTATSSASKTWFAVSVLIKAAAAPAGPEPGRFLIAY